MLTRTPAPQATHLEGVLTALGETIDDGVVAATLKERRTHWHHWKNWLSLNQPSIDPYLHRDRNSRQRISRPKQIAILEAYCCHVRYKGNIGGTDTVRASTVSVALRSIASKCQLAAKFNIMGGKENKYPKSIRQMLEGFKRKDPPSQPRLAIPLSVIKHLQMQAKSRIL